MGGGKSTGSLMECRGQDMFCWERGASFSVWWPTRKTYTLLEEKHCHLDSYLLGSSCVELRLCDAVVLSLSFSLGVARGDFVSTTPGLRAKRRLAAKLQVRRLERAPVFSLLRFLDIFIV